MGERAPADEMRSARRLADGAGGVQKNVRHLRVGAAASPALDLRARCKREQRSNQRSLEMSDRQSSYEPPVVEGERVPTPMGRVPASKLESRGAVV